ncbi:hypothetical protein U1Q18_047511 [Sarracenia purpurea var. burkii]
MAYEGDFCRDYLVLKPEEASLLDLFRFLCSSDVKKRKFIRCPEPENLRALRRRWVIFIVVLVQKLLLSMEKPLAWTGNAIQMWLNLPSFNGGFRLLLLNLFTGLNSLFSQSLLKSPFDNCGGISGRIY